MKFILKLFFSLVVLVVLALLAAPYFITADKIKGPLIEKLEAATGKKISIGDKFELKFFPTAGVYMENVTVSDGDEKIAAIKSLNVEIATVPLFSGNVVVQSLLLDDPVINLRVDASGKGNWLPATKTETTAATANEGAASPPAVPLKDIQLSNVQISNGKISYDDRQKGKKWSVANLDLAISLNGFNSPLNLKGNVDWNGKRVAFESKVDTLQHFIEKQKSSISLKVNSDMLAFNASGAVENETFNGAMATDVSSLANLQQWLQPGSKSSVPSAIGLNFKSSTKCSAASCHFANIDLKLGTIVATGDLKINTAGSVPVVNAVLAVDDLDLNQFMPQQKAEFKLISDAYAADKGWSREAMDLSALRSFEGMFDIKANKIRSQNVTIGKTSLSAKVKQGTATISVPSAEFYSGTVSADTSLSADGAYQKSFTAKNINIKELLKDAAGNEGITGTANLSGNFSGKGRTLYDMMASMQGTSVIKVTDGTIKGFDILNMAKNARSMLTGSASEQTKFTELSANYTIVNGVATNNDLVIKTPAMTLSGTGKIDLAQQTLAYRVKPVKQSQAGESKAIGFADILFEGPWDNITAKPDLKSLINEAIQNPDQLKKKIGNVQEELKNLKGLFKKK